MNALNFFPFILLLSSSPWLIILLLFIHSLKFFLILPPLLHLPSLYMVLQLGFLLLSVNENCCYAPNQFPTFCHIPHFLLNFPSLISLPFSRSSHLSLNFKQYLNTDASKIRIPYQLIKFCTHRFQSYLSFHTLHN